MIIIQKEVGEDKQLEPQQNTVRAKQIERRVEELLPKENFYFFKLFGELGEDNEVSEQNKQRREIEQQQLIKLIDHNRDGHRYYLK